MNLNTNNSDLENKKCNSCSKILTTENIYSLINDNERIYYCEKYKCLNFDKIILSLGYKKSKKCDYYKFKELEHYTYFRKQINIDELDEKQDVFMEIYRPNFFYTENWFGEHPEYIISSSYDTLEDPYITNKITCELRSRDNIESFIKQSEIKIIKTIQFLLKDKN